ncbi:MAG TPA: nucleotidyltransferase family protein [Pirellulales bacterium]
MLDAADHRLLVTILAAGASRRLGQPKQLVDLRDEPLLRRQCRMALAAKIGGVAVILGYRSTECAATIADLPVAHQINAQWEEGLASSIREAVRAALAADATGLGLLHVDQYRLEAADLRAVHAAWSNSGGLNACVSTHAGASGPPVIFPKRCFDDLMLLEGDSGARGVLSRLPTADLCSISVPNAFHDLDLPAELAGLLKSSRSSAT